MSALNDPGMQQCYQRWLGITFSDSPPTHYELLGVKPFESDVAVIQMAAQQRAITIRRFQNSAQGAQARIILHEITKAKTCLLNGEAKRAYDRSLSVDGEETLGLLDEIDLPPSPAVPILSPVAPSARPSSPLQPIALSPVTSATDSSLDALFSLSDDSEEFLSAQSKVLPPTLSQHHKSVIIEPKAIAILVSVVLGGLILLGGLIFLSSIAMNTDDAVAEKPDSESMSPKEEPVTTPTNSKSDIWTRRNKEKQRPEDQPDSPANTREESIPSEAPRHRPIPEKKETPIQNPFTKVVHKIDLPKRPASSFGETEVAAVSLGAFASNLTDKLSVELTTKPGWESLPITFQITPREGSDSSEFWDIHAKLKDAKKESSGLGQTVGSANSPVAVLSVLNDNFQFQWLNSSLSDYLEYLRFHSIRCEAGEFTHQIALRVMADFSHIPLEFTERRQKTLLSLMPLPPDAKLSFEVFKVDALDVEYRLVPMDGIGQLNDSVDVNLDHLSMRVKLEDTPKLAVVVSAEYEIRRQEYDFFANQLKEHVQGLTKKLTDDTELALRCQRAESNISSRMSALERIGNSGNKVEKALAAQEWGTLAANLKTVRSTMKRIGRSRPILIADLNQAQRFANWRTSLASKATLRVKIRATLGDQTFDIAEYGVPQ